MRPNVWWFSRDWDLWSGPIIGKSWLERGEEERRGEQKIGKERRKRGKRRRKEKRRRASRDLEI